MRRLALVALLGLACTQHVELGDGDPLDGLVALTITPGDRSLEILDLASPAVVIDYAATGEFADGTTRDVTADVAWRVDNPEPGDFVAAGHYETSQRAAGRVQVSAIGGAIVATASLRISITATIIDSAFPPPLDVDALFAPGLPVSTDPMRVPAVLYPSNGALFPQGLPHILFQHLLGQDNDAVRLAIDSDVLHLTVLTSSDRWQPDGVIWFLIAASHLGAQATLAVQAASSTAPGTIYAAPPSTLAFSRGDPGGVLTYWSEATNGVLRAPLGALGATPLYPPRVDDDDTCFGCHTISRDGTRMAGGTADEMLQAVDLSTLETVISAGAARIPMGWATYSPDGSMLLVANKGALVLRDATTGAPIGPSDGRVNVPMKATHPDWSPDGSYVVVALGADVGNMDLRSGSIARIPFLDGMFGEPEVLVPGGPMDNNYFPRYSPDGRFIAYVNARTNSEGAASAELRLIPAGGGTPIALRLASHRVGATDDVPDLASTMPSWGPSTGDVQWLSFSSTRPYGAITPQATRSQIWITGLDLSRLDGDPSHAAIWLPSQDSRVLNNNPIWVVAPESPARESTARESQTRESQAP